MGLKAFRRSAVVACVAAGAVALTSLGVPAGAEEEPFVPGSGQVEAQLLKVGPSTGRLSFAPGVGIAYADYQNTVGRAISRYFDFVALDDSIPPELKENAPVVQSRTGDEPQDVTTAGFPGGSPIRAGGTRQEARATEGPLAEAVFSLGDFSPVPGALEMSGGRVVARSGVLEGTTRLAEGVVSFGRIALGGDAVVLQGATWRVRQTSGADEGASGGFTVDGITAGGQELALPEGGPTAEQWAQVNDALAPLGLRLDAPRLTEEEGIVEITPLRLRISANEVTRAVGPPLLEGLQPVREPLTSGLIDSAPEAAALVLLGDVALGALAGTGAIDIELGGSTAFTEGEAFDDPFGGFDLSGDGFDLGPVSTPSGSFDLGGDLGGSQGAPGSGAADGDDAAGDGEIELAGSRTRAGTTGGPALVVGLLGLLAVLGMAGADWWRLRHEPRRIAIP